MNPERLRQIEELYHALREQEVAEREAFLAQAAKGDEELLREVTSLLAQDSSSGPMERPILQVAAGIFEERPKAHWVPGAHVGPYEILSCLGEGGMGEVYKARDTRLGRNVAIKIIHSEFSGRVQREARAISALNHPHICTLYDIGPDYLVMEFLEGETLAGRLRQGRLPMNLVVSFGAQIAGALEAAHVKGIIHRDLKPANIMVTNSGIKVLDFGIAKIEPGRDSSGDEVDTVTVSQVVLGTPAYMAPEQIEGRECDALTDIFALGAVLYEMTAGKRAFAGVNRAALMAEIVRGEPSFPEGTPASLQAIINKCLAKEPGKRYQKAAGVRAALESISTIAAPPVGSSRRLILVGALAVAAMAATIVRLRWERVVGGQAAITAVAVLPFENLSKDPEQEFFAAGMHQQLINDLSKIRALRVIARSSVMRYKGTTKPLAEIARELGVDGVVEGSVLREGNRVRITTQLIQARTGRQLWGESYDRSLSEVLALQLESARTIAGEIRIAVTPEERTRLAAHGRADPEAQELVMRGQYWADKTGEQNLNKAIDYFEQAIARDPTYAPAQTGLAGCYNSLSIAYRPPREVQPKIKAAARRAIELDETSSDAHLMLGRALLFFDWDWPAAEKHLKRALQLNSNSAEAHITYGQYFIARGQTRNALTEFRLAQALDPLSLVVQTGLLFGLIAARQFDQVIAQAHETIEREPNYGWGYAFAALAHAEKGEFDQAIDAMEKASKIEPMNTTFKAFRAHVQAAKGNRREAEKLLAELKTISSGRYVCAYEVAHAYVKLGDKEAAFRWLEKGRRERADCMVWLAVEPWMDPLRADPRYRELIEDIGLKGNGAGKP